MAAAYTPLFAGVLWDLQDVLPEDIDRIEVIRGPGATMWGANAVNGVINIITRHSRDSQGGLAVAGAGSEEQGFGALRAGGRLGGRAWFRSYSDHVKTYFFERRPARSHVGLPAEAAGLQNGLSRQLPRPRTERQPATLRPTR